MFKIVPAFFDLSTWNPLSILLAFFILLPPTNLAAASKITQPDDIYIIFYATKNGHTGHVAIAIDKEELSSTKMLGQTLSTNRPTKNGELVYFDLWGSVEVDFLKLKENTSPRYFKFPNATSNQTYTLEGFLSTGISHQNRYNYPCDALLRIETKPAEDKALIADITAIMQDFNYYNAITYNCVDFIITILETHLKEAIEAKESVMGYQVSVPNKLYLTLKELDNIQIIKKPGNEIYQSFLKAKILKTVFSNRN